MNIVPVGIAPSRCSAATVPGRSAPTAIQSVLASNIGKTITVYTTAAARESGAFTGLLSTMAGGAITLIIGPAPGCYRCAAQLRAAALVANTSVVIPTCYITAVALPNG